jgi:hypothetical protein
MAVFGAEDDMVMPVDIRVGHADSPSVIPSGGELLMTADSQRAPLPPNPESQIVLIDWQTHLCYNNASMKSQQAGKHHACVKYIQ